MLSKRSFNIFLFLFLFSGFIFFINFVIAGTQTGGGVVEIPNPVGATTFAGLIGQIVDFLILVIIPIATIMILYAGLLFMTSGGSVEKVQKAKQTLTWAVVGIAILLISRGITSIIASFLEK